MAFRLGGLDKHMTYSGTYSLRRLGADTKAEGYSVSRLKTYAPDLSKLVGISPYDFQGLIVEMIVYPYQEVWCDLSSMACKIIRKGSSSGS